MACREVSTRMNPLQDVKYMVQGFNEGMDMIKKVMDDMTLYCTQKHSVAVDIEDKNLQLMGERAKDQERCQEMKNEVDIMQKRLEEVGERNTLLENEIKYWEKQARELNETVNVITIKTNKINGDNIDLRTQVTSLKKELQEQKKQSEVAVQSFKRRQVQSESEIRSLQRRLSSEIVNTVSSDAGIENVSQESRPLKLKEIYESICSNQWLSAVEAMRPTGYEGSTEGDGAPTEETHKKLCGVFEMSSNFMNELHSHIVSNVVQCLLHPLEDGASHDIQDTTATTVDSPMTVPSAETSAYLPVESVPGDTLAPPPGTGGSPSSEDSSATRGASDHIAETEVPTHVAVPGDVHDQEQGKRREEKTSPSLQLKGNHGELNETENKLNHQLVSNIFATGDTENKEHRFDRCASSESSSSSTPRHTFSKSGEIRPGNPSSQDEYGEKENDHVDVESTETPLASENDSPDPMQSVPGPGQSGARNESILVSDGNSVGSLQIHSPVATCTNRQKFLRDRIENMFKKCTDVPQLPRDLQHGIDDLLVNKALKLDVRRIAQVILEDSMLEWRRTRRETLIDSSDEHKEKLLAFVTAVCHLTWAMAVQNPPVKFESNSGVGKNLNPKFQNPYYACAGSGPNATVKYYIYPTMLQGKEVLVLGKVFIE